MGLGKRSRKARTLLALLAVERQQRVPVERIVDVLWDGQPPATAERTVASLVSRLRGALGATITVGGVVIGHRLGLYKELAKGPATVSDLAAATGTNVRYVTEWLRGQAAGGYVSYDPVADAYSLTEEQAFALARPDSGVYVPGAFLLALATLKAEGRITDAFRTGAGFGWHEQDGEVFTGCEQFFRPGYIANLVPSWIPALDGVRDKLQAGTEAGRHLAGRRAVRRRRREGQPEPRRPRLLRLFHPAVRAERAVAARRLRHGRAGGRGGDPPDSNGRRVHALPARCGDAVQHRLRGPSVGVTYLLISVRTRAGFECAGTSYQWPRRTTSSKGRRFGLTIGASGRSAG